MQFVSISIFFSLPPLFQDLNIGYLGKIMNNKAPSAVERPKLLYCFLGKKCFVACNNFQWYDSYIKFVIGLLVHRAHHHYNINNNTSTTY